jgi:hypothetical protein
VRVAPGGTLLLRVDGAALASLAAAAGLEQGGIPARIDRFVVNTAPGFEAEWSGADGHTILRAVPAPEVIVPEGWDPRTLGRLFLSALGMGPQEAAVAASRIDWGSALVVPVPRGVAEARDVAVDGVFGIALMQTGGLGSAPGAVTAPPDGLSRAGADGEGAVPLEPAALTGVASAPSSAGAAAPPRSSNVAVDGSSSPAGFEDLPDSAPLLLWQKGGVLYALAGDRSVDALVAVANSLE